MARLQGLTLGQRQQYYNQLVKEAIANNETEISKINFDDDDVENMIRIDKASHERKVDYIINVFKSDDMLYASRAIKKSIWLITDAQYAHIINPAYLHRNLFPEMNDKAIALLMFYIKRHLKDELRVISFFKYVNEKNPILALQWLYNCPLQFKESIVAARAKEFSVKLLTNICRKNIHILRLFTSFENCHHTRVEVFNKTKYFMKHNNTVEEFLDIIESKGDLQHVKFNKKYTNILMKKCFDRIMDNFLKFHKSIDLNQFAKFLQTNDIKPFLMKNTEISRSWLGFRTVRPFLVRLPRSQMLNLLTALYNIDRATIRKLKFQAISENLDNDIKSDETAIFTALEKGGKISYMCRWYQFMPFSKAFRDIKRCISIEFSPKERNSMMIILLACANSNVEHVKTVLQYYYDNLVDEPKIYKINFINSLLSQHDSVRFDDSVWNIVNNIITSLDIHLQEQSDVNVQKCLMSIIVRTVLRDEIVNELVKQSFDITVLKDQKLMEDIKNKLSTQEQNTVFKYLYNLVITQITEKCMDNESGMQDVIRLLMIMLTLLKQWNKVEEYNQLVVDKIAEIEMLSRNYVIKRKSKREKLTQSKFTISTALLFVMLKSHRKLLFDKSVILNPCAKVCTYALKHDPLLLIRSKHEINKLRCNCKISVTKFLNRLRIYWPNSLAVEWRDSNIALLQKGFDHKSLLQGVFILSSQNQIIQFIEKYNKHYCNMSNTEDITIQRQIVKNLHLIRPNFTIEALTCYINKDFLEYTLPFLYTIGYKVNYNESIFKWINTLIDSPTDVKKHVIRLLFALFKTKEVLNVAEKMWNTIQDTDLRPLMYVSMFQLLFKENNASLAKSIWSILSSFTDDLNMENNNVIYNTLGGISKVPLIVAAQCYQKIYLKLKSLPQKPDLKRNMDKIAIYAPKIIEHMDNEFIENSLLGSVYDIIVNTDSVYLKILSAYLLCSKDKDIQEQRYNKLVQPVIDECSLLLKEGNIDIFNSLLELLRCICCDISYFVFEKKMAIPKNIVANLNNEFWEYPSCLIERYIYARYSKIIYDFLDFLVYFINYSIDSYSWEDVHNQFLKYFIYSVGNTIAADEYHCINHPSVYVFGHEMLKMLFADFGFEGIVVLKVFNGLLDYQGSIAIGLVVLEMLPKDDDSDDDDVFKIKEEIKRKLYFHSEKEVVLHYFQKFEDKYCDDHFERDEDPEDDYKSYCETLSDIDVEYDEESVHEKWYL